MDYPVKYITSTMRAAPPLTRQPGALVAILDALLVTGWGALTVTTGSVSGGVATLTFATTDAFGVGDVVLIAAASPAQLNGEARVVSASGSSITIATTAPDGPVQAGAVVKFAPAGWKIVFTDLNKRVYQPTDPRAAPWFYWVDDSNVNLARWAIYESMTDINTGAGRCPTTAQFSEARYGLVKWCDGAPTNTPYYILADSLAVTVACRTGYYATENAAFRARGFGHPVPMFGAPASPWDVYISTSLDTQAEYGFGTLESPGFSNGNGALLTVGNADGSARSVQRSSLPVCGERLGTSGADGTLGAPADRADNMLFFSRILVGRSELPGVLYVPQSGVYSDFATGAILIGEGAVAGRRLLALRAGAAANTGSNGVYFLDMDGPWR